MMPNTQNAYISQVGNSKVKDEVVGFLMVSHLWGDATVKLIRIAFRW